MRAALRKAGDVTARRKSARSTRHSARPALGNRPTSQPTRPSARPALRSTRRPRATLRQWNTIVVSEPISVGATGSLYRLPAEVLPYAKHHSQFVTTDGVLFKKALFFDHLNIV